MFYVSYGYRRNIYIYIYQIFRTVTFREFFDLEENFQPVSTIGIRLNKYDALCVYIYIGVVLKQIRRCKHV